MYNNMVDKRDEGKLKADLSHLAQSYGISYRPSQKDIKLIKFLTSFVKMKISCFLNQIKEMG